VTNWTEKGTYDLRIGMLRWIFEEFEILVNSVITAVIWQISNFDVIFNCSCIGTIISWTYWQDTADPMSIWLMYNWVYDMIWCIYTWCDVVSFVSQRYLEALSENWNLGELNSDILTCVNWILIDAEWYTWS